LLVRWNFTPRQGQETIIGGMIEGYRDDFNLLELFGTGAHRQPPPSGDHRRLMQRQSGLRTYIA
jgi:hypothetical protein